MERILMCTLITSVSIPKNKIQEAVNETAEIV